MHVAVRNQDIEMVRLLANAKANGITVAWALRNADLQVPLVMAAEAEGIDCSFTNALGNINGLGEINTEILASGVNGALGWAIAGGHADIVLLENDLLYCGHLLKTIVLTPYYGTYLFFQRFYREL
jgi:hypothetical protein